MSKITSGKFLSTMQWNYRENGIETRHKRCSRPNWHIKNRETEWKRREALVKKYLIHNLSKNIRNGRDRKGSCHSIFEEIRKVVWMGAGTEVQKVEDQISRQRHISYLNRDRVLWMKLQKIDLTNKMTETQLVEAMLRGISDRPPYISEKSVIHKQILKNMMKKLTVKSVQQQFRSTACEAIKVKEGRPKSKQRYYQTKTFQKSDKKQ